MRVLEKLLFAFLFLVGAPALLWASGHVTATYFVATSATSTSAFAGSIAAETSGFVYDASTNRVGIGIATPQEPLHIKTTSANTNSSISLRGPIRLSDGGSLGATNDANTANKGLELRGAPILIGSNTSNGGTSNDYIAFNTTDTSEKVRLTSAGNFGIGTTTPATKLDVNGLIRTYQTATTTCSASVEGSFFYSATGKHFYGCDGTIWKQLD